MTQLTLLSRLGKNLMKEIIALIFCSPFFQLAYELFSKSVNEFLYTNFQIIQHFERSPLKSSCTFLSSCLLLCFFL